MNWRTLARLGLAAMTSLVLLTACAGTSEIAGGYGNPTPSEESPDH